MKTVLCVAILAAAAGCAAKKPAEPAPPAAPQSPAPPAAPAPTQSPATPTPPTSAPEQATGMRNVFPHIRVDAASRVVEIDGTVPIDAHNEETPRVYLEVIACTPDTKEHEALVVTRAKPSEVHAALLLIGLEPGKPGEWNWEGKELRAIPPQGPRLRVTLACERDGARREEPASDWIETTRNGKSLSAFRDGDGFVFAGSRMVKRRGGEMYWADGEGTLIGLTTFGGETIAWSAMYSHDSGLEEPHWIAAAAKVPPRGTPVTIRISPVRD